MLNIYFSAGDSGNVYTNPTSMNQLPWSCNFGSNIEHVDYCGFIQDDTDDMEWIPIVGPTPTNYTGPPESSLDEHGMKQCFIKPTKKPPSPFYFIFLTT